MIKIGDWVKHEDKKVGKVIHVYGGENNGWAGVMFSVGCMDDVHKDLLTKLPIKFKGFEFNEALFNGKPRWCYTKVNNKIGRTAFQYSLTEQGQYVATYCNLKTGSCGQSFPTIEQAKDWLELQYATMIAKARGLI